MQTKTLALSALLMWILSANAQEISTLPSVTHKTAIAASLQALQNNGMLNRMQQQVQQIGENLIVSGESLSTRSSYDNLPAPIKHILLCDSLEHCETASQWGNNNHYNATSPIGSRGHGAQLQHHLFFRHTLQPDVDSIHEAITALHESIQTLEGISYATWMLDTDPDGERDLETQL